MDKSDERSTSNPADLSPNDPDERILRDRCAALDLDQKIRLLSGASFWFTASESDAQLRSLLLSDGGAGVRGALWDERDPSVSFPCGTVLGATWDTRLMTEFGIALAAEARRKNVDLVLAPNINLQRTPFGGRNSEMFGEDPVLVGSMAVAQIASLQRFGVAATPKHYVANDYETERYGSSSEVDDRTLREVYLVPFQRAIVDAGAWAIMSAYNAINGVTASEHDLLRSPLRDEWGFDGLIVSDWTAVRSVRAAAGEQDLAMPGPSAVWGAPLRQAVTSGALSEEILDEKVIRLLRLAHRVGALGAAAKPRAPVVDVDAFAYRAAVEGTVLLRNSGVLPLSPSQPGRMLVIGDNARHPRSQPGGAVTVVPVNAVSPLEGLRERFSAWDVEFRLGAVVQHSLVGLAKDAIELIEGGPGLRVRFYDRDAAVIFEEVRNATLLLNWFDGDVPLAECHRVELSTVFTPSESGSIRLGVATAGTVSLRVDGREIVARHLLADWNDPAAALLAPPWADEAVEVSEGVPIRIEVSVIPDRGPNGLSASMSVALGAGPTVADEQDLIADAVAAARDADVVVIVVGTNEGVESEGWDRETLALPGAQDELVEAIAAVRADAIVVVNAGSPVLLPWREDVGAIVVPFFGGQSMGTALADILSGDIEPGGRLPMTWPSAEADVPISQIVPHDGLLAYEEGIHIGYRGWILAAREPAYAFGFGLGFTSWKFELVSASRDVSRGGQAEVIVEVTNTGSRRGKCVVQVYAERSDSAFERPRRWLAGFGAVVVDAGESRTTAVAIDTQSLLVWNDGGWTCEPGEFTLLVGSSSADFFARTPLTLAPSE